MMSVKYIGREKTLFPSGHKFPNALRVLFLKSRRGGANVMNSYEK